MWETLYIAVQQNEKWKCQIQEPTREYTNKKANLTKHIYKIQDIISPKNPKKTQKCPQCQKEQKNLQKLFDRLEIIQPRNTETCSKTQQYK